MFAGIQFYNCLQIENAQLTDAERNQQEDHTLGTGSATNGDAYHRDLGSSSSHRSSLRPVHRVLPDRLQVQCSALHCLFLLCSSDKQVDVREQRC